MFIFYDEFRRGSGLSRTHDCFVSCSADTPYQIYHNKFWFDRYSHSECTFWRVHLPLSCTDVRLEPIATLAVSTPAGILFARALYPPSKLAILSLSDSVCLVDWEKCQQWRIEVTQADEEELVRI